MRVRPALTIPTAVATLLATALALLLPGLTTPAQARAAQLADRIEFGAYVDGITQDPSRLGDFERMIGAKTDLASIYWGYGDVFPGETELALADGGRRKVLASWDMGETRIASWSQGVHDAYLDQLVEAARAYPYTLHVRPWPEMNGDWQHFQPTRTGAKPSGGTYEEFIASWRYVVDYFRDRGVTNLRWVFNPTVDVYSGTTHVNDIWPGDEYVDVLGLDGFNWGRDDAWGSWASFDKIFAAQYRRLTALSPTDPVWICEVASKEPRRSDGAPKSRRDSKAKWIRDMMTSEQFPRLTSVIWFHERKERDWRVNSSPSARKALRKALG